MRKVLSLSFILTLVYCFLSGWILFHQDELTVEALFNAAMERAIRGEF